MKKTITCTILLVIILFGMAPLSSIVRAQTDTPAISVSPVNDSRTGLPGSVIGYSINVQNTGTSALDLTTALTSLNDWSSSANPTTFHLEAGQSTAVNVNVAIPANASAGAQDVTTVQFMNGTTELGRSTLNTGIQQATQVPYTRPLVVIDSYGFGDKAVVPGTDFTVQLALRNNGKNAATNVVVSFSGEGFSPRGTGGVIAVPSIDGNTNVTISQDMAAALSLSGYPTAPLSVRVAYTDSAGNAYTETFTITISLKVYTGSYNPTPTVTPTLVNRAQVVVGGYTMDVDPLQPGAIFNLELDVRNLGLADARSVTMVLGGGGSNIDPTNPTPQPGGVSGAGSDLSVFAPLGSSNLVFLGDISAGQAITTTQKLIVNVSANPGAYSFKLSFVYTDGKGARVSDDQIITLLVYRLPQVEVGFYRDPGMFMTGTMNQLPLQVTNLGRYSTVLGNMKITADNADITNNVALVGALESGGYFTLDANVMPMVAGDLPMTVTINYTDDFNQPRTVVQVISVPVLEMPTPEPFPTDGTDQPVISADETIWQKIGRFFKGLFGLGSDKAEPEIQIEMPTDTEGVPTDKTVPVSPKG